MRALLWGSVLLMGLWSGYWFVGRTAVDRTVQTFFAEAPRQGLIAEHGEISLAGFPNRFDLTVTDPHLGDPVSGLDWRAPFVQILSLSYKPWHVIAAFAPNQTVTVAGQTVTVSSDKLQASVVVTPNSALTLDRTTLIGSALSVASNFGWSFRTQDLRFATRQDPSRDNTHEIGLDLLGLTPDASLSAVLRDLPAMIDRVHLDAFAGFSGPLDRFAGETRPTLTLLDIREASLTWGRLSIFGKGELALANGIPEGRLDIRVQDWQHLMPVIEASGAVKPEVLPTVERMLETLASQSGDPNVLDLPLIFTAGQMRLGPLPLGPAPRL